jgi:hypothetical protein
MRRGKPHPSLIKFRLCREFGWTPQQLNRQPAKTVEEFVIILNEIDRQTEAEVEKAEHGKGGSLGHVG